MAVSIQKFPPRLDWDRAPWNRWSFQNMREIIPTAEVWRGVGRLREFTEDAQALDDLSVASVAGAASTLKALLDETFTDGFLVLKDGDIVFERYFNGMSQRSLHLSQSVAKSFTGAVAGILAARGILDVAAPVTDYLPELVKTGWKGATLQQVLNMTSGVRFSEEYTDPFSDIGQVDVASGWKPIPPGSDAKLKWPAHMFELILGLKETVRPHGAGFEYRSIETDVLAFCMERATGKRLSQLVSEELWQKMGAEQNASFTIDSAGYAIADGGLNACLRDYARFGQLLLSGGDGIIPAAWIEATRNGVHNRFSGRLEKVLPQGAYQNQFWVEDAASRSLLCRGVFGQMIYVSWQYNMVVVKLSSWPEFVSTEKEVATLQALHKIGQHLSA